MKVPSDLPQQLIEKDGIIPFMPMGRKKMKEWIQINRTSPQDYLNDIEMIERSIAFVATLVNKYDI